MDKRWYEYWFSCLEGVSNRRKIDLRKGIVPIEDIYNIEESAITILNEKEKISIISSKSRKNWKEEYDRIKEKGIHFVSYWEEMYPERLRILNGMPYALFYKGCFPRADEFPVAIVGARRCTAYGENMTLKFSEELARQGILIISGMARGIDGIAHRGALNVHGKTCAVLGCGVDVCYPKEHKGLYQEIGEKGSILSEFPPGTSPLPHNFPARNRIISGLSEIVMVMEAKEKSGSLITADMALEQGKDVYALPGNVDNPLSRGCNQLISYGAGILLSPEQIMEDLVTKGVIKPNGETQREVKNKIKLEREEDLVYSCLDFYPKNKEQILNETKMVPYQLNSVLVSLELKGYIEERSKNYYVKRI